MVVLSIENFYQYRNYGYGDKKCRHWRKAASETGTEKHFERFHNSLFSKLDWRYSVLRYRARANNGLGTSFTPPPVRVTNNAYFLAFLDSRILFNRLSSAKKAKGLRQKAILCWPHHKFLCSSRILPFAIIRPGQATHILSA